MRVLYDFNLEIVSKNGAKCSKIPNFAFIVEVFLGNYFLNILETLNLQFQ